jgi:integrase
MRADVLFLMPARAGANCLGPTGTDVDLERRLLHVRKAKGGRQRVVPIHPVLEPLFADYLRFRTRDPEPALFTGVQGTRLSMTILSQTFRR